MRSGQQVVLVSANDHVHTWNSAHYDDRAVDIQGTGLDELAAWYRGLGLPVYWQVPGHWQHVHVEVDEEYLNAPTPRRVRHQPVNRPSAGYPSIPFLSAGFARLR